MKPPLSRTCLALPLLLFALNGLTAQNPAETLATRLLVQARQAVEQGQDERAIGDLEQLQNLAAAPAASRGRGQLLLAWLYARGGQNQRAAEVFSAAAANAALSDEERRQARISAAGLLLAEGQPALALERIDAQSDDPDETALRGRILLRLERFDDAAGALTRAISALERRDGRIDPVMRQELAAAHQGQGDWPAALQALDRLLRERPRDTQSWRWLGDLYLLDDQPRPAAAAWQTALALNGEDPDLRLRLARLYLSLDLPSEALRVLKPLGETVLDAVALSAEAIRAESLYRLRQPREALAHWRRLARASGQPTHRLALARLLSELEEWPMAHGVWQDLLEQAPDLLSGNDRLLASIAAFRGGQADTAIRLLQALQQDPDLGGTARQWLTYLRDLEAQSSPTRPP